MDNRKLELVTDFYEFTMSNGYFAKSMNNVNAYFDVFFREIPDGGGYVIFAGLEQIIEYIQNLHFDEEDIIYLKSTNKFSDEFLNYLKNFKFSGDIWAVPEGTVVFPTEPLITVKAPLIEAQLLETMLLLLINHQSLIATKASRIVSAAKGRPVMEFGARRAHSIDAAVYGARAAIIGGCVGTSCTLTAQKYNVPASGTMAHSFIQSFDSEYEAFKAYAENYPDDCTLLIDTYDSLGSGINNAIKVFDEVLTPMGYRPKAVRIDSGDLSYLSKKLRVILVIAEPEDSEATVTVKGNKGLEEGENNITVTVEAEAGNTKTYTINVTKTLNEEAMNTRLKSLIVQGFNIYPSFQNNIYNYNINISEEISKLDISAETENEKATFVIKGNEDLKQGDNLVKIIVTAEDGVTTGEYKINVFINSNVVKAQTENKLPALILLAVLTVAAIIIAGMLIKKHKN